MSRRFIFTILTLLIIGAIASAAIFVAKGYRLSGQKGTIVGTGILSITSVPDQASIYLDGHLTSATNTNVNSLPAKVYKVRIEKEGFIPWEKEVEVTEGLVSQIKATLYRAIPSIYPLTYTGALNSALSPDGQKLVYVVPPLTDASGGVRQSITPQETKKAGIWVWTMGEKPITLARGAEPHQIAGQLTGVDYTAAKFRFSPDSAEVLVTLPDRTLLLDTTRLNDPPRDVTPILEATLKSWSDDQKEKDLARVQLIKDLTLRQTASSAAVLKWAPDESKFLYSTDGQKDFKVVTLIAEKGSPNIVKTYDLPASPGYSWMPDSTHLLLVESTPTPSTKPVPNASSSAIPASFPIGKVSVLEYDGFNKSELYIGTFEPNSVIVWPDASRLVIVSSFPTATASKPNLYGINLK